MREIDWDKVEGQGSGLLTAVVQDEATKLVLMVVYLNREAYTQTWASGWLTLFSRKTQALRVQGESRNCRLGIVMEYISCGRDAVTFLVHVEGNSNDVCHHGSFSCFIDTSDLE